MGIYKLVKNGRIYYRARVMRQGKRVSLGYHKTEEAAAIAVAEYKQRSERSQREQEFKSTITPIVVGSSVTIAPFSEGINTFIDETRVPEQIHKEVHVTFNDKLVARPFIATKPSFFNSIKQLFHK